MNCAKKPKCKPLWIEGMFSSDYELDSLPLAFSCNADFDTYYTTLCAKYPRKRRETTLMRDLSKEGRELRLKGDFLRSLDRMQRSCAARLEVFENDDYQLVAAQHHLCLTATHYATHAFILQQNTAAYTLFLQAKNIIGKSLPSVERPVFEVLLHNNWANYWLRRRKYTSVCQSSRAAVVAWEKLLVEVCQRRAAEGGQDSDSPAPDVVLQHRVVKLVTTYLYYRHGTAQLYAAKHADALDSLSKSLTVLNSLENGEKDASGGGGGGGGGGAPGDDVNSTLLDCSPIKGVGCPVSALNICITSPCSHFDAPWPLQQSLRVALYHNIAYAFIFLLQFDRALVSLEKCASHTESLEKSTGKEANPHWQYCIQAAVMHCKTSIEATQGIKRVRHKNKAALGLQTHFMQEHLRAKGTARGSDALLQTMSGGGKPARPPPTGEANDTASDCSGDGTAEEWRLLIPSLERGLSFREFDVLARRTQRAKQRRRVAEDDVGPPPVAPIAGRTTPPGNGERSAEDVVPPRAVYDIASRLLDKQSAKAKKKQTQARAERTAGNPLLEAAEAAAARGGTPDSTAEAAQGGGGVMLAPVPNVVKKGPKCRPAEPADPAGGRSPPAGSCGLYTEGLMRTPYKKNDPHIGHPNTRALLLSKRALIEQQQQQLNSEMIASEKRRNGNAELLEEALLEVYATRPDEGHPGEAEAEEAAVGGEEGEGGADDTATAVSSAHEICAEQARNLRRYFATLEKHMFDGAIRINDVRQAAVESREQAKGADGYCDTQATSAPAAPMLDDAAALQGAEAAEVAESGPPPPLASSAAQDFFNQPQNQRFEDFNYNTPRASRLRGERGRSHSRATPPAPAPAGSTASTPPGTRSGKRFKQIVRAAMKQTTEADDKEYWERGPGFFNGINSVYRDGPPAHRKKYLSPVKMQHSYVKGCGTAGERQRRLRALLPHLDQHGEMYRMVTNELASNQHLLTRFAYKRRFQEIIEVSKGISRPTSPATDTLSVGAVSRQAKRAVSPPAACPRGVVEVVPSEEDLAGAVLAASWAISACICLSEANGGDTATVHTAMSDTGDAAPEGGGVPPPEEQAVPVPPV